MLEFLALGCWLVRFLVSYPFSWLAHFSNFLAVSLCGYRQVVSGAMVVHPRFGYAILVRSKLHRGGRGKWLDDIDEADTALRYEFNRAVDNHKHEDCDLAAEDQ